MTDSPLFESEMDADTLIVNFSGNITAFDDAQLLADFQALIAASGRPAFANVIVDFGQMAYFGSSMLEALLVLWNEIHPSGGKLVLCNVSSVGREILDVSNFSTLWPICQGRQEAMAVVRGENR